MSVGAVLVASLIGQACDGSTLPLAIGYLAIGVLGLGIGYVVEERQLFQARMA